MSPAARGLTVISLLWVLVVAGCGKPASSNPAEWNQSQVDTWIRQQLTLTELSLSADGERAFQGTGRDAAGKSYELKVTQADNHIKCEYTSTLGTGKGQGQFSYSASSSASSPPPQR